MTRTPTIETPPSFVETINFRDITQLQVVGKGTFGIVHKGKWRDKIVAIKKIESEKERKAFQIEIIQLSRVSHPNIVKLYGSCDDPVCLVMEYAEGGSLYNVLHGSPQIPYTLAHAMSWVHQTASGVAYLHDMQPKPLIHRDLKPPNLLLINGGTVLKICDFGTACDKQTYMTNSKGSAAWMAPEVFESNVYTEKCDIFSWGVILWEVLTRRKPFDDIGGPAFRIMWHVHKGNRPPQIADCPPAIELLMTRCWDPNPNTRPSMRRINDVTGRICELLPGADIPLQYPTAATMSNFQDNIPVETEQPDSFDEFSYSITPDEASDDPHYLANTENGVSSTTRFSSCSRKSLPSTLPSGPLTIDVDKNAWDFQGESDDLITFQQQHQEKPHVPLRRRSEIPASSHNSFVLRPPEITQPSKFTPSLKPATDDITIVNTHIIDKPRPIPPPKPLPSDRPTTLNLQPTPSKISFTGPAITTTTLPVPQPGHRRTASDGSGKIDTNTSRGSGSSGTSFGNRESKGGGDSLYDNAYLMLEPEFQPISPATDISESMRIFEEHKKLAKDYLQTRTEIECLLQAKKDLEQQLREQEKYGPFGGQRDSQRILKEWRELKSENESLVQYHRNLKKQLEIIKSRKQPGHSTAGTQEFEPEPGWVMVSRKDDNKDAPPPPPGPAE
ncbi:mitogen-activated protein kinase kinase kinase 7 [Folsomia candida]|uniref:mitogen-activated protein kinase kinase kinase 7 n=1 Tax=Folsomia candida TaxID=158441 RepID=UPI000B8F6E29|nr:mitogen-activated protein kinase kinase kinase 7 [Folsomia candida]